MIRLHGRRSAKVTKVCLCISMCPLATISRCVSVGLTLSTDFNHLWVLHTYYTYTGFTGCMRRTTISSSSRIVMQRIPWIVDKPNVEKYYENFIFFYWSKCLWISIYVCVCVEIIDGTWGNYVWFPCKPGVFSPISISVYKCNFYGVVS